ncbi:MAG: ATP-binding protein [Polyangiaceae bacterium]|nr:ATP-binding protein [Polyangiaceae bacterium]
MLDLRTRTSLFCALLALAIAASLLLRRQVPRPRRLVAALAGNLGLWYLAQWLYLYIQDDFWARATAILAVPLPHIALNLFEALIPEPGRRSRLPYISLFLMVPVAGAVLFLPNVQWSRALVFTYTLGFLIAGLTSLWRRSPLSQSRGTRRRLRFLVSTGSLAALASMADFLWFLDLPVPPLGAVLSILFLFVLSESLIRRRFVDIYDIASQVILATLLSGILAAVFYLFFALFGTFDTMYLTAFLATFVILVLFEPLREKVSAAIHRIFFRERVDLERLLRDLRRELAPILEIEQLAETTMRSIEASRRATGAALYVRSVTGTAFERIASFGPTSPQEIESAQLRPILLELKSSKSLVLERLELNEFEYLNRPTISTTSLARLLTAREVLGPYRHGVICGLEQDSAHLDGMLMFVDDRSVDAYSIDEVSLLEDIASQVAMALGNTRQHRHLQAKDRLAALGQMATGLAHEVKNPLGAIQGAAQLLEADLPPNLGSGDFVQIILEEVARLDRIVGSVLDYARPASSKPQLIDISENLERVRKLFEASHGPTNLVVLPISSGLKVRADAELLRQVLLNLVRNAQQASGPDGQIRLAVREFNDEESSSNGQELVAIDVSDDGPGIAPEVKENLFVPFVTTKSAGTGLGLAISQRIVEEMLGKLVISATSDAGTTFSILLPRRE